MRRLAAAAVVAAVVALLPGCGGDHANEIKLDGSPRVPDDEGIATALSRHRITLDGKRSYAVSDRLRAFSTYTLALEPMVNRQGQYVQVGLDGKSVIWMAGIAGVVGSGQTRSVYYVGQLIKVDGRRLVFRDGTVLRRADRVRPPLGRVQVRIDPRTHRVVEIL